MRPIFRMVFALNVLLLPMHAYAWVTGERGIGWMLFQLVLVLILIRIGLVEGHFNDDT